MTATNHALTGAVIALAIKQPVLALPLAFISHFALDALPHFGEATRDVFERNNKRVFKVVIPTDTLLVLIFLIWLLVGFHSPISRYQVLAGSLAAVAPDFPWIYRFMREIKTHTWQPGSWFLRFHERIQWCEREWGLVVEIVWAVGCGLLIGVLRK